MSKSIHHESVLHRTPKAVVEQKVSVGGKVKSVKSFTPLHQTQIHRGRNTYETVSFKGVPSNLFNGGGRFVGQVQQGSLSTIKSATLKITIKAMGGDCTLSVPSTHFFERIELKAQNGSKPIATLYSDTMYHAFNLIETDKLEGGRISSLAGIGKDWKSLLPGRTYTDSSTPSADDDVLWEGAEVTYYLPIIGSIFGLNDIYFANAKGDLNIEFFPASEGIIKANSTGTIACQNLELIAHSEILAPQDESIHRSHFDSSE
jgi:hypothetical protein